MADTTPIALEQLLLSGVTRPVTLWTVTSVDGAVLVRLTDHDRQVVYDGQTFTPVSAPSVTARDRRAGLGANDAEMASFIDADAVSDHDLASGRYDGAVIAELYVDADALFAGPYARAVYYVEEVTSNGDYWEWRVRQLAGQLQRQVGRNVGKRCDHVFGSSGCGFTLGNNTVQGVATVQTTTVASVAVQLVQLAVSALTGPTDLFFYGSLKFTSGANSGLSFDIANQSGTTLTLSEPTPEPIAVSDGVQLTAGCDYTYGTCVGRFNNGPRFGGFPTIPGTDALLRTPRAIR